MSNKNCSKIEENGCFNDELVDVEVFNLDLNSPTYGDVKSESKSRIKSKHYSPKIGLVFKVNRAIMTILFNYFNIINNERRKPTGNHFNFISRGILNSNGHYNDFLPDSPPRTFSYLSIISYNGNDCAVKLDAYNDGESIRHVINISSITGMSIKGEALYKKLFNDALILSELKGSYFTLPNNQIN